MALQIQLMLILKSQTGIYPQTIIPYIVAIYVSPTVIIVTVLVKGKPYSASLHRQ